MKNELMLKCHGHSLPTKAKGFVPYTKEAWDELAAEKNIIQAELETWIATIDNSMLGKKWMEGRTKPNVQGG